jgi:predicted GNAT superfamily acetyltransferase
MAGMAQPQVRELTDLAAFEAAAVLFDEIWRPDPAERPVNVDLLRALSKAGNYVAGAYEGGRLVGAAVGFFGPPAEKTLHSHIAGATPAARGVGFALKLHQRAWTLERGVPAIAWTFDPLISRNAYFNLTKRGARPVEYLPNFYGNMRDGINAGDESDRLLVRWDLTAPVGGPAFDKAGAVIGLDRSMDGRPAPGSLDGEAVLVAVPPDVEKLRAADPAAAREWRLAVRSVLGSLLAGGARVAGFDRDGWYLVRRGADG